ncbi:MAG: hypothetical protein KAR19_03615 [Bacteroidales bacterium]|nr:hypothetical protein [Bacteroidales bacterium]
MSNNTVGNLVKKRAMDINFNEIMEEVKRPSQYTKEQFMELCPGAFPSCDQETEWWEEWFEKNKTEVDEAYQQHCQQQAAEYFNHKLFLRDFLEENSINGRSEFILQYDNRHVVITPLSPEGKSFKFKL